MIILPRLYPRQEFVAFIQGWCEIKKSVASLTAASIVECNVANEMRSQDNAFKVSRDIFRIWRVAFLKKYHVTMHGQ
jgi:hypothetical protein